jgi:hypothetical protein
MLRYDDLIDAAPYFVVTLLPEHGSGRMIQHYEFILKSGHRKRKVDLGAPSTTYIKLLY